MLKSYTNSFYHVVYFAMIYKLVINLRFQGERNFNESFRSFDGRLILQWNMQFPESLSYAILASHLYVANINSSIGPAIYNISRKANVIQSMMLTRLLTYKYHYTLLPNKEHCSITTALQAQLEHNHFVNCPVYLLPTTLIKIIYEKYNFNKTF